jgi:hypothetical protein
MLHRMKVTKYLSMAPMAEVESRYCKVSSASGLFAISDSYHKSYCLTAWLLSENASCRSKTTGCFMHAWSPKRLNPMPWQFAQIKTLTSRLSYFLLIVKTTTQPSCAGKYLLHVSNVLGIFATSALSISPHQGLGTYGTAYEMYVPSCRVSWLCAVCRLTSATLDPLRR